MAAGLAGAFSLSPSARAASLASERQLMNELQQQVAVNANTQAQDQQASNLLSLQVNQFSLSIANVQAAVTANDHRLAALKSRMDLLRKRIVHDGREVKSCRRALRHQLRVMYEKGAVSYLSVLFAASSWHDFLNRMDLLVTISRTNRNLELHLQALTAALSLDERSLGADYRQIAQRRNEDELLLQQDTILQQKKQAALFDMQHKLQGVIARHGELESQIVLTHQQIQAIEAQTAAAEAKMKNSTYVAQATAGMGSVNVKNLLAYANSFMGTPYVWGGTSPSGFDCSGFVQYVFAHFGISLPRTSYAQYDVGTHVAYDQLQPGDLVFFATNGAGASHVGIYIGGGEFIGADTYATGVHIDSFSISYWMAHFVGATVPPGL